MANKKGKKNLPSRVLMYANGFHVETFYSMKEARRYELNNMGHWYDPATGEPINPKITLVTEYLEEKEDEYEHP